MTCPYYRGPIKIAEGSIYIVCNVYDHNEKIGPHFEFDEEMEEHRDAYCLGKYPQCLDFKKSEEVTHE